MKITKNEMICILRLAEITENEGLGSGWEGEMDFIEKLQEELKRMNVQKCLTCFGYLFDDKQFVSEDEQHFCSERCRDFYEDKSNLGIYKIRVHCQECQKNIAKEKSFFDGEKYFCNKEEARKYYHDQVSQYLDVKNLDAYLEEAKKINEKISVNKIL